MSRICICKNCGNKFREEQGENYNIGRVNILMCPQCYKVGSRLADARAYQRVDALRKQKEKANK